MLDIVLNVLGVIIVILGCYFSWPVLLNKKIDFKNHKIYIAMLILIVVLILTNYYISKLLKFAIVTFILTLTVMYIFNIKFKKSFITVFYLQVINLIDEVIFSLILILLFKYDGNSYSNFIIFLADILCW